MKTIGFGLCLASIAFFVFISDARAENDNVSWVNMFIGTGGEGFGVGADPVGPQTPFGNVRLCPDTGVRGTRLPGRNFGGYHYSDSNIWAFSHTHMVASGTMDCGNIGVLPMREATAGGLRGPGYPFSHNDEDAMPGYYEVTLGEIGVRCELTATTFVGVHRYTFPEGAAQWIKFDPTHTNDKNACKAAELRVNADREEITGWVESGASYSARAGGYTIYFVAKFDRPWKSFGTFDSRETNEGARAIEGTEMGANVFFGESDGTPIGLKVAISFINIDEARNNLQAEVGEKNFDDVRHETENKWRDALSVIDFEGGTDEEKIIFATALYHAQCAPTRFTEESGRYLGFDREVHEPSDSVFYSDLSLWDTFRTLNPLLVLARPEVAQDVVRSMVRMYEQGGDLPMWAFFQGYTGGMIGTHSDSLIADAYLKGLTDFDAEKAYEAMRLHAMEPRPHAGRTAVPEYLELGYVPADVSKTGTSETVEYAYDDWCIANLANALGKERDAAMFYERAKNYTNVWDPQTRFFRGRNRDGSFVQPFVPVNTFDSQFVEGDAWHWRWFAPHDVPGLIDLFGGDEAFVTELSTFFERASRARDTIMPDLYYWHGNEPDIHAAYMFNYAGRADLTQRWARWVAKSKYSTLPSGIDGNDDYGTLSAWYIFSAMGFYPLAGSTTYIVGSPIFERVTIHREAGDVEIVAHDASPENIYVERAELSGKPLSQPFFDHEGIKSGGKLEFWMTSEPRRWVE
ncbi:MAG: GH92 family glycosyl hydrolase [Planctomycetes bacterium]|nr:GH92 family glycosyl hydrolase [Planctomycetota bacterium]